MTGSLEFIGKVSGGKLPTRIYQDLMQAAEKLDGKTVIVSISEQKRRRSTSQNGYYFGVVVKRVTHMFREAGNYVDEDEVHEFLKQNVGKLNLLLSPSCLC